MRTAIIVIICVLSLLGATFAGYRYIDRKYGQPTRDLSKMMSVRITIAGALTSYYEEHKSYPRSLGELPLHALKWGDEGSSIRDLDSWSYISNIQSFRMNWEGMRGLELFLGGRNGKIYYAENEMR